MTGGSLISSPNKWSILQLAAVCCFTSVGYSGFTSLPYYVHLHSGLFFVAYYALLVLICVPVCYVQVKLGAMYRRGLVGIFSHLVPILKGVAAALLIMTYFRSITHALEISYGIHYMVVSCFKTFPWGGQADLNISSQEAKITIFDNIKTNPEDRYFINDFVQRSPHIGSWGPLVWHQVLCSLLVWLCVYLCICRGSAGFAKVLSVLVPLTAVLLVTLLIYGYVRIPRAQDAFYTLLTRASQLVNKEKGTEGGLDIRHFLSRPKIWLDSLDLHVYGLGLWAGTMPFLGTHLTCNKKVITLACVSLLGLYCVVPHLLLVTLAPYIDSMYDGGILGSEVGVKPGLAYLFVSIPHTFSKHGLSHFMAFLLYLSFVLINLQHLSLHILMIWENASSAIPRAVVAFFRRPPLLSAIFILISFLLSLPYLSQCGIYLYQIIRFYVDRLIFSLIIFSMVPCVIGFIRQESLRTPIDRVFMGVWYGMASVMAACLLIYNFVVYVYPEAVVAYEQRWAENLGWCVSIAPLVLGVTLGALHTLFSLKGSCGQRLLNSLKTGSLPSSDGNLLGDNCPSADTGDTDLKSPCLARRNLSLLARHETASPVSHARAPLLQAHGSPPTDWRGGARETTRAGREDVNNQIPKVHRKNIKSSDTNPNQSKGNNPQKRSSSKRHSCSGDGAPRKSRAGNTSPRKRKSAFGALGRENSGFGEDEQLGGQAGGAYSEDTQDRHLSYQGDCCSSGACGCNTGGVTTGGEQGCDNWNCYDGDMAGPGSLPVGYGTLQASGTPKASVEVILKSASDGNMVRL